MSAASESKRSNRKAKKKRSAQQMKENQLPKTAATSVVRGFVVKRFLACVEARTILPGTEVLVLFIKHRLAYL
jgi:hypothetical protein